MQSWAKSSAHRLTVLAMLAAVAFVLSWIDSMIPVNSILPGAKLGLANLCVLTGLCLLGPFPGFVLCVLKVLLSTILFGNAYSFFYAMAGGMLSYLAMLLLRRHCSLVFVSVTGGVFHNIGQIAVAALVLRTAGLWGYLPLLLLCGLSAGCVVGMLGGIVTGRLQKILKLQEPGKQRQSR